jgi:hypothetical protein
MSFFWAHQILGIPGSQIGTKDFLSCSVTHKLVALSFENYQLRCIGNDLQKLAKWHLGKLSKNLHFICIRFCRGFF